jgi:molybdate transport system substrate-binding protein
VTRVPIHILAPAAFAPALEALAAGVQTLQLCFAYGPASGAAAISITSQLHAGTDADFAILPKPLAEGEHAAGRLGALLPLAVSSVAFCVSAKTPAPEISSEDALISFLSTTASIGLSPAGSGIFFRETLLDRLGLRERLSGKLVEFTDMPVYEAVRLQKVAVGFQQKAELMQGHDITVLADLPAIARNDTALVLAKTPRATCPLSLEELLAKLNRPEIAAILAAHGLGPAA